MFHYRTRAAWAVLSAACLFLAGCGNDGRPPMAKVSGTVQWKGKPLAGASISFHPDEPGLRPATGVTDDKGHYTVWTYEPGDGAVVGKHKVVIALLGPPEKGQIDPSLKTTKGEAYYEQVAVNRRSLIPEKYSYPEKSGLTAEVVKGKNNTFDFTLEGEAPKGAR